jgi:predicted outer membrane protein
MNKRMTFAALAAFAVMGHGGMALAQTEPATTLQQGQTGQQQYQQQHQQQQFQQGQQQQFMRQGQIPAGVIAPVGINDMIFLMNLMRGNAFEVEASRIALQQSANRGVYDFANRMRNDHLTMNDQILATWNPNQHQWMARWQTNLANDRWWAIQDPMERQRWRDTMQRQDWRQDTWRPGTPQDQYQRHDQVQQYQQQDQLRQQQGQQQGQQQDQFRQQGQQQTGGQQTGMGQQQTGMGQQGQMTGRDDWRTTAFMGRLDHEAYLTPHDEAKLRHLRTLRGWGFDRAYAQMQVKKHEDTLREFQRAANTSNNPDVRGFAMHHIPTIERHLEEARALAFMFEDPFHFRRPSPWWSR